MNEYQEESSSALRSAYAKIAPMNLSKFNFFEICNRIKALINNENHIKVITVEK